MSKIIQVFFEGMSSLAILSAPKNSKSLDPKDYIHNSAADAIRSDWETVGTHLIIASKKNAVNGKEKSINK